MAMRRRIWVCFLLFAIGLRLAAQDSSHESKRFYVVFLRPDPARKPLTKEEGERIQKAHMANILKMAADGVMISAGPFDDTPRTISGIFVFTVDSLETAKAIAAKDPTVVEHRNTVDVHVWDGPAQLGVEYFRLHKLDPKTPENMQMHPFCIVYRGAAWETSSGSRAALMAEHAHYVEKLRADGKLGAAGGIAPPDDMLGLVIFKPIALEDAQKLLENDPAVKSGVLRAEYHQWWSSDHVLPW
jgi:uncharacterized protein YciI